MEFWNESVFGSSYLRWDLFFDSCWCRRKSVSFIQVMALLVCSTFEFLHEFWCFDVRWRCLRSVEMYVFTHQTYVYAFVTLKILNETERSLHSFRPTHRQCCQKTYNSVIVRRDSIRFQQNILATFVRHFNNILGFGLNELNRFISFN